MSDCAFNLYELPTLKIIGGETKEQVFDVFYDETGQPMQLSGFDCKFSVSSNLVDSPTPIFSKPMNIATSEKTGQSNALAVQLASSDTISLNGKYIYQVSIHRASDNMLAIFQGIMYVRKNIDVLSFA